MWIWCSASRRSSETCARRWDAAARARLLEGEVGSLGWTRTNDQRINSPTLYRLSYQGTENQEGAHSGGAAWFRQAIRPLFSDLQSNQDPGDGLVGRDLPPGRRRPHSL